MVAEFADDLYVACPFYVLFGSFPLHRTLNQHILPCSPVIPLSSIQMAARPQYPNCLFPKKFVLYHSVNQFLPWL